MHKARIVLLLGIWVAILPYLGFPYLWKNILFSLSGLGLVFLSYLLYHEYKIAHQEEEVFENFKDNTDFSAEENKSEITKE